jgi:hypothetical protein
MNRAIRVATNVAAGIGWLAILAALLVFGFVLAFVIFLNIALENFH